MIQNITSLVTPTLALPPGITESDDCLPIGAAIGITAGILIFLFILLLIIYAVIKK